MNGMRQNGDKTDVVLTVRQPQFHLQTLFQTTPWLLSWRGE
jgi:hypothetical protein